MPEPITILIATSRADLLDALPDTRGGDAFAFVSPGHSDGSEAFAVAFVDWLLPDTSGLEMCRRLRAVHGLDPHIVIVLDEDSDDARSRALRAGADDYVLGPLTCQLIEAKLGDRLSSPARTGAASRLVCGELTIDLAAHQARYRGRLIALRPNELRLLALLAGQPDRLHARSSLIAMLGKDCDEIDERTVDVWVGRLRRSLKAHGVPDMLRTVRSQGYVFDSPAVVPLSLAS